MRQDYTYHQFKINITWFKVVRLENNPTYISFSHEISLADAYHTALERFNDVLTVLRDDFGSSLGGK